MTRKVPQIVNEWCASIQDRSPQQQLSFYSKDAVLLATFESMCVGHEEMYEYFIDFLDKKELRCRIIDNLTMVDVDRDSVIANGLYGFTFTDEEGVEQDVIARYTFVINNGFIITQHSSLNPE
tara:strand:+ start:83 stop:451 length:369 start_codon:yes stop_codon:yes gene_type:complete